MVERFDSLVKSGEIKDEELQELLSLKEKNRVDFKLIDIREAIEYSNESIVGTDLLYPTSKLHLHVKDFEDLKNEYIILYCRTGNRTGQVLKILKRMGFEKVAHLTEGIVEYSGKKVKNAPIPNNLD